MKNYFTLMLLIFLLSISFISCDLQGEDGAVGATGATGPQGQNGSVNITTYTFVVSPADWQVSSGNGVSYWNYSQQIPAINQQVLNTGVILTYYSVGGFQNQMPFTDGDINYRVGYANFGTTGSMLLSVDRLGPFANQTPSTPFGNVTVKVVVIPQI